MFHDIQDTSTVHLEWFSGGVPAFWAALASNVHPHRLTAFTSQLATAKPVFGLGILRPGTDDSALPNTPIERWAPPSCCNRTAFNARYCDSTAGPPHNLGWACQLARASKGGATAFPVW